MRNISTHKISVPFAPKKLHFCNIYQTVLAFFRLKKENYVKMSHKLTAQIVRYCDILLFSLLRGSGLKFFLKTSPPASCRFSLLRGSGLKSGYRVCSAVGRAFSLLRGSGLKCPLWLSAPKLRGFSLLRGSGLKYISWSHNGKRCAFSLLRGSGLKLRR